MPLVQASKISKHFGGLAALNEVDLSIEEGELVGLIGPNGAGKSTLVNVLSGFFKPSSGKITLKGEDVTGKKIYQIAKRGMVRNFQSSFVFKNFSVLENVVIGCHIYERPGFFEGLFYTSGYRRKLREYNKKAEELLEIADLGAYKDTAAGQLPYGHQRLLGIIVAVATDPRALLLDEPVTGMNPQEIAHTLDLVKTIKEERKLGVLLIEHNVRAIMGRCDRMIVLNFGVKIADGKPKEVSSNKAVIDAYLGEEIDVT